ncbi:MBL fold metallo-hydrolase [Spiroplasma endosymbiont of Othius punctulatus]|uniref:MBL fold metallo-hydrolase n=1 Tax=Spiroplasma endosymbiont of Othius punctulatus TaxID=3066289 RepID=UPI0030CCC9AA
MKKLQVSEFIIKREGVTRDLPKGNESLRWVASSATLIYSEDNAILIDTFTTIKQNNDLIEWIKTFNKKLTHIYITHGHGDHFYGIKQLTEAFPEAVALSTRETAEHAIREGNPEYIASFWGLLFPNQIPEPQVFPKPLVEDCFEFEGNKFEIIKTGFTDTNDTTALWIPNMKLVVAGDVVYNGIHQYMSETTTESRINWIESVNKLIALKPETVIANHKIPENSNSPKILENTKKYIEDFNSLDKTTNTTLELYNEMLKLYPNYANPGSLWGGSKKAKK